MTERPRYGVSHGSMWFEGKNRYPKILLAFCQNLEILLKFFWTQYLIDWRDRKQKIEIKNHHFLCFGRLTIVLPPLFSKAGVNRDGGKGSKQWGESGQQRIPGSQAMAAGL